MVQIVDIQKLIRKHKYEVSLQIMKRGEEITASFPCRQEKPFCEAFSNTYKIEKGGVFCQTDTSLEDFIETPKYALRSVVFADVFRICNIIGYSSKLLGLYIKEKEQSHDDFYRYMLPFKLSPDQTQQENALEELVNEALVFNFSQDLKQKARDKHVFDGFQTINNILSGETL
jgi:hypothetical protein